VGSTACCPFGAKRKTVKKGNQQKPDSKPGTSIFELEKKIINDDEDVAKEGLETAVKNKFNLFFEFHSW